jgi:hypothetical protein
MQPEPKARKASPFTIAKAVLWSFLGIRRSKDYNADVVRITPLQAIIGGLIGGVLFVLTLLTVVYFVTH